MSRKAVARVVAAALVLLPACGSGQSPSIPVQTADAGAAPTPPTPVMSVLTKARHYPGIVLAPPPAAMHPLTSPEDAYRTCWAQDVCAVMMAPEIALTLYSNSSYGQMQADGSLLPTHQNVLAYAITWRDVPFMAAGSSLGKAPAVALGDNVVLVDANTGQLLLGYQGAASTD